MEYAIEVRNLTKRYKGFTLDDISFALPQGTVMGLIGENGAGTLLPRLCFGADGGFKGQIRDHFQPAERIRKYGFAFDGKTVLIG